MRNQESKVVSGQPTEFILFDSEIHIFKIPLFKYLAVKRQQARFSCVTIFPIRTKATVTGFPVLDFHQIQPIPSLFPVDGTNMSRYLANSYSYRNIKYK
jgi:hypothetical protein